MQVLLAYFSLRKTKNKIVAQTFIENNLTKFMLEFHFSLIFGKQHGQFNLRLEIMIENLNVVM